MSFKGSIGFLLNIQKADHFIFSLNFSKKADGFLNLKWFLNIESLKIIFVVNESCHFHA